MQQEASRNFATRNEIAKCVGFAILFLVCLVWGYRTKKMSKKFPWTRIAHGSCLLSLSPHGKPLHRLLKFSVLENGSKEQLRMATHAGILEKDEQITTG